MLVNEILSATDPCLYPFEEDILSPTELAEISPRKVHPCISTKHKRFRQNRKSHSPQGSGVGTKQGPPISAPLAVAI